MYKILFVFFSILSLWDTASLSKRNFFLEYYNFTGIKHSRNVKILECDFMKAATSSYLFNVRMMFRRNIGSRFTLRFLIDIIVRPRNTSMRFIESKFNGCDNLNLKYDIPILTFIILEIRRTSNLPYTCPFQENILYEIRNLSYSDKYLPTVLPFANFTVTMELYNAKEFLGSIISIGAIVPKRKK